MPCKEQCHYLVSHLSIAHAFSRFFVPREQEPREQIARIGVLQAVLGNNPIHYSVKRMAGSLQAAVAGCGNAQGWERSMDIVREQLIERRKGLACLRCLVTQINMEEYLANDLEGQAHHLRRNIQWLILLYVALPLFEHSNRSIGHQGTERSKMLAMEDRLYQASLTQPGLTVVRNQPIADKRFQRAVGVHVFVVVLMIVLEHVLYVIRVKHHVGGPENETDAYNIAIVVSQCQVHLRRIALNIRRATKQHMTTRAWRPLLTRRFRHLEYAWCWIRHHSSSFFQLLLPCLDEQTVGGPVNNHCPVTSRRLFRRYTSNQAVRRVSATKRKSRPPAKTQVNGFAWLKSLHEKTIARSIAARAMS